jgi:HEPN domain-containing protein
MVVPLDEPEFTRWREEAQQALIGAHVQRDASIFNWSCFMCEQAAQLAVKGLLHAIGGAPWGHDLVALIDRVAATGLTVPDPVRSAAQRLSRHYIPARYPDAHGRGTAAAHYGRADADAAIDDAAIIINLVDEQWQTLRA